MQAELWPLRWRGKLSERSLRLLEGTPFNCLVVDKAGDAARVRDAAARRNIQLRTLNQPNGIPAAALGKMNWKSESPILAITECEWPRVRPQTKGNSADAGPTGVPWVDSNGWVAQLAAVRSRGKQLWLAYEPPKESAWQMRASAYTLAVADAAAHGAKWLVTMPEGFYTGLEAGQRGPVETWKRMVAATDLFAKHPQWRAAAPLARLGVISDFAGDNEFLAGEILNLVARRHLPYRIFEEADPGEWNGLTAMVWASVKPPTGELLARLVRFAENGGTIIAPPKPAAALPQGSALPDTNMSFALRGVGKGRVAAGKEEWGDPYTVAADVYALLGRREDVLRLWNHESCGSYVTRGANGLIVHLLRFGGRPSDAAMTVGVASRVESAKFYSFDQPAGIDLKIIAARLGTEMPLPRFNVYAAIEMGGAA